MRRPDASTALIGMVLLTALLLSLLSSRCETLAQRPGIYVALMLAPSATYLWAVYVALRWNVEISTRSMVLLQIAVAAPLLACPPLYEDDYFRYAWDGRVALHGINPYAFAPAAPELVGLRDENFEHLAYPTVPTIYPPVAQLYFGVAVAMADAVHVAPLWIFRLLNLACSLTITWLLATLLRIAKLPSARAVVWMASPLVAKELLNSAHYDGLAIMLTLLGWLAAVRHRPLLAGALLGLSVDAKLFAIFLLAFVALPLRRRDALTMLASAMVTSLICWLPYLSVGAQLWKGFFTYARLWEFNAPLFPALKWMLDGGLAGAGAHARAFAGVLLVVVFAGRWIHSRTRWHRIRDGGTASMTVDGVLFTATDMRFALVTLFALTPTLDPWYVTWVVPLLALAPSRAWLLLSVLVNLSYLYYANHVAEWWMFAGEFGPVILMAGFDACRAARRANESR